jgi:hypothetical protein
MRFPIRLDPWWRPVLLLVGVTPGRSYVELRPSLVFIRFGWLTWQISRARLAGAEQQRAPFWYGIGIHTNLLDTLVINGSLGGMVLLHLDPPMRLWLLLLPILRCRRLFVSLEDPAVFLAALDEVGRGQ